jgi:hypothetical protein
MICPMRQDAPAPLPIRERHAGIVDLALEMPRGAKRDSRVLAFNRVLQVRLP